MAGLQEVWGGKGTSQAEVLADHLGMYSAFAVPNREQPVALLATLDHPAGPLHMRASCVEWEPEFADEHLAQTRALAVLLVDPGLDDPLPVLLTADLNAPPNSPQVRALTDVMVDSWVAGGGDPYAVTLSTRNPFAPREASRQIDQRFDYVLARPGRKPAGQRPDRVPDRAWVGRSHNDALVGCMVWSTTANNSAVRVSIST